MFIIGTALQLYTDDYDETIPGKVEDNSWAWVSQNIADIKSGAWLETYPGYFWEWRIHQWNSNYCTVWSWMDQLFPYVKNLNMYMCPSGPKTKCYYHKGTTGKCVTGMPGYGYNARLMRANYAGTPITLSSCANPSHLVFIGDAPFTYDYEDVSFEIGPFCYSGVVTQRMNAGKNWAKEMSLRHNNGANFTFADGHAKYYKKTNTEGDAPTYWKSDGSADTGDNMKFWEANVD